MQPENQRVSAGERSMKPLAQPPASDDFHYAPWQTSLGAVVVFFLLEAGLLLYARWSTGTWLPWIAPQNFLHILATILLFALPLTFLQYGWTYTLTAGELVVLRFGKVRNRLELKGFLGTRSILGVLSINFRFKSVWIPASADDARQAFLHELKRRAAAVTFVPAPGPRRLDGDRIRLPVELLRFPDRCVACREPAQTTRKLTVQRGFDLLLVSYFQFIEVQAPTCRRHSALRGWMNWVRRLTTVMLLVAGVVPFLLFGPESEGPDLRILGAVSFVLFLLSRPLWSMVGEQLADWLTLGVRASRLSADLTEVTVQLRDPELREFVLASKPTPTEASAPHVLVIGGV